MTETYDLPGEPVIGEREVDSPLIAALDRVAVHLDHLLGGVLVVAVLLAAILAAIVFNIHT